MQGRWRCSRRRDEDGRGSDDGCGGGEGRRERGEKGGGKESVDQSRRKEMKREEKYGPKR